MTAIVPVILCGGSGTRLWPLSSPERPKQFHDFGDGRTLFQETAARLAGSHGHLQFTLPVVIANAAHEQVARQQLDEIGITPRLLILEPAGRNTAAAAALAAEAVTDIEPGALALLAPADHRILDAPAFRDAILRAAPIAQDRIVTFGIDPTGPATGYGYIERGGPVSEGVFDIVRFREKPPRDVAERLWRDGRHAWNAGIFLFSPDVVQAEFAAAPEILATTRAAWRAAGRSPGAVALPADLFGSVPSAPFDVAVMETTRRSAVVPCDIGWADLGAWDEVWRTGEKDTSGNATSGTTVLRDVRDCLVIGDAIPTAVCGVEGLIVIASANGVIVLPKERAQDVKAIVEMLDARRPKN